MKNILYIFSAIVILGSIGCQKDDYTGQNTTVLRDSGGTLTMDLPSTVVEGNQVIPFTLTVDPVQVVDLHLPITSSGTATEGADYTFDHSFTIPAFTSEASGALTIIQDTEIEGDETVTITFGNENTANLNFPQTSKTVTITNYESDVLDLFVDWNGPVNIDGVDYDLCSYVDIDVQVFDAAGTDVSGYSGATSACPEHVVLTALPDGVYSIEAFLYYSGVTPPMDSTVVVAFPSTINYVVGGVANETQVQSPGTAFGTADLDFYYGGNATYKPMGEITVSGGEYSWTTF